VCDGNPRAIAKVRLSAIFEPALSEVFSPLKFPPASLLLQHNRNERGRRDVAFGGGRVVTRAHPRRAAAARAASACEAADGARLCGDQGWQVRDYAARARVTRNAPGSTARLRQATLARAWPMRPFGQVRARRCESRRERRCAPEDRSCETHCG